MCWNCQFKTGWYPGGPIGKKVRFLFEHLNFDQTSYDKLIAEALRIKEFGDYDAPVKEEFKVKARGLPNGSKTFEFWSKNPPKQFLKCLDYINKRNPRLLDFELYWTPEERLGANKRFSIPVYYGGEIVGYSARWFHGEPGNQPRYINQSPAGLLFNHDKLEGTGNLILVDGGLDALSVDGAATLKGVPSEQQTKFLNESKKNIVVLPDRDYTGGKMIDHALANEWLVSFPKWDKGIKDAEQAMAKYGRLYTIDMILDCAVEGEFSINFRRTEWQL